MPRKKNPPTVEKLGENYIKICIELSNRLIKQIEDGATPETKINNTVRNLNGCSNVLMLLHGNKAKKHA
jgi:hypothetical protein